LFNDSESELAEKLKATILTASPTKADAVTGVPDFWITVLRHVALTSDMIQEVDEDILKHLVDIRVSLQAPPATPTMGFTLHFVFAPNSNFTNTELTKRYTMHCAPDMSDPAEFDGPEIIKSEGCTIDWMPDKNVTVKLVKKKQKNKKQAGATRFVTKQVKADSFFNFFDPPPHTGVRSDDDLMDESDRMLLHMDFEIGQCIRDTIVPHALFHYTQEADDEDDDFDEDDEDEEDEDDENDDE